MGALGGIPFDVGDVLAKKYRLDRLVGEGGTGVVVAARHLTLDQTVAIKFLRTALASEDVRLRFEREARAIAKIQSEHVVVVFDVGALDDGAPYMVMEYLEGKDLAKILADDGPLGLEDAVDCMMQVCDALAQAHAAGIVHRDLKPANLFLTRRAGGAPHVKVVDFGISKILDQQILGPGPKEMTGAFEVLGSPRYMAPEQLRSSKAVDLRANLWSVGAVLFRLATGKHAFEADSNMQAGILVTHGEPAKLRDHLAGAPPGLEDVVGRCLAKDRASRFQSARELADALRPFASARARAALDDARDLRSAPNVEIALGLSSVADVSPDPASPENAPALSSAASAASPAAPDPPSSPPATALAVRLASRGAPLQIALAVGGVVAVLVAFGVLSLAKQAAHELGIFGAADPAAEPRRPSLSAAPDLPPGAVPPVSSVVLLDAGRAPP